MNADARLVLGVLIGLAALPLLTLIVRLLHVSVEEGEVVLITRFGRLARRLERAGWHLVPDRVMPWTSVHHVSLRREHRIIEHIQVNDALGTTVFVDVFLELRIEDAVKATFGIASWEQALTNVVSHAVISILGTRELPDILRDRTDLRALLQREIAEETARWGVRIERVFLRDVRLLAEVEQQILRTVAAKLERWKADIEEEGRQRAAMHEARTSAQVAGFVAEARAQYPLAVGRAYAELKKSPRLRAAYDELYELSLLHPHRTVAFVGFGPDEVRAVDAAMLAPHDPPASAPRLP